MKNKPRSDGRLQSKVYLGNGKYKYVYASTNRELEQKVQEIKIKLGKGIDVSAERDTFGYWRDKWLEVKKVEVSAGRYRSYKMRSNNLRTLFPMAISAIRTADIQEIIIALAAFNPNTKKPMAKQTLKDVKGAALQIFKLAYENRVIEYNPAAAVKIPQDAPQGTRKPLTPEQQQWIVDTPHKAQTAAMIMLYAGLRRGELIPLTWGDINVEDGIISINKSVEYIDGMPKIKSKGKTKSALRNIYLPQRLIEYLRPLKKDKSDADLVYPNTVGKPLSEKGWRKLWDDYICELNLKYGDFEHNEEYRDAFKAIPDSRYGAKKLPMLIPRITAHCLRHTYITLMYLSGIDVLTAKEQAGHSNIKVTLDIYTHLDSEYKKKNVDKMDNYLEGCQMGGSSDT